MKICIVCNLALKDLNEAECAFYNNEVYYFCSSLCKILFLYELERFLSFSDPDIEDIIKGSDS